MFLVSVALGMFMQASPATILCTVSGANAPIANADVIVNGRSASRPEPS